MKSTQNIDAARLLHDVDAVRISRGVTWNQVFHQTWITNLSQVRRGLKPLSLTNAHKLAEWAGLDLRQYEQEVAV